MKLRYQLKIEEVNSMNLKSIAKELYDCGRDDCWTSDDTYDFSDTLVALILKKLLLKNWVYIDQGTTCSDLVGTINHKISSTLESIMEEYGDPWGPAPTKNFKQKSIARLLKVIKKQHAFAFEMLNKVKEELKTLAIHNKERDKFDKKLTKFRDSIWFASGEKRKNVKISTTNLEFILSALSKCRYDEQSQEEKTINKHIFKA